MNKNFAVFILSHSRASNIKTIKTLRNSGYTGRIFIVLDDEDVMKEDYIRIYGTKNVIVFSKEEWKKKTDTITNEKDYESPVYARNFISCFAKEKGYKYYMMLDDDITSFNIRYIKNGKLKSCKLKNADSYFFNITKFMETNKHISYIGTGNAGSYIGGAEGRFSKGIHIGDFSQSLLCSKQVEFKGIFNEDENMSMIESMVGNLCMVDLHVSHSSPKRKSNKGGLKKEYDSTNDYYINMFSVICCPSCCYIVLGKKRIKLESREGISIS